MSKKHKHHPHQTPPEEAPQEQPTSVGQWVEIVFAILIIGGGLAWLAMTRAQQHVAPNETTSMTQHGGGENGFPRGGENGFPRGGAMPVAVATARTGNIPVILNALGTVTPLASVTVQPQISGTLEKIDFTEGATVKKGDPLALIDPRPYEAALAQYTGDLARDAALLQGAKRDLARYNRLLREDSISRQQQGDQQSLVRQYEGTVKADKAQIASAKLNIAYCHIKAPIGGRIGLRQVNAGNYVSLNTPNGIVSITQTQPTSVLFSLPEDNLPEIMKRLKAGAKLPVAALDRNRSATLAQGTLETVDNAIDTSTGTIRMRADFANKNDALFPNQFVNVRLLLKTLDNVIVIPEAAVHNGAPGDFVYVVTANDTVRVTPVRLGAAAGGNVAVLYGLAAGDTVVTEGADKLKDGSKVTVPSARHRR